MTTPDFSAKLGQRVAPNLFILKRLPAAIRSALTFIAQLRENVVAHEKTPNVLLVALPAGYGLARMPGRSGENLSIGIS